MRRNFLRSLAICLVPTLIAAAFVGWAMYQESKGDVGFRRGIDLAGGTILVYEVKSGDLPEDQIKLLADKLKKRIDPNDLKNVVVRPLGRNRIEIILPFAGGAGGKEKANAEFVDDVRLKVKQTGVLEFRIVANPTDDTRGIEEAVKLVEDPANAAALKEAADKGLPPPAPIGSYNVKAAGDTELPVKYEWVELGKEERDSLGLSQEYAEKGKEYRDRNGQVHLNTMFQSVKAARELGKVYPLGDSRPGDSYILYSRKFTKLEKTSDEQAKTLPDGTVIPAKDVEYFMLTRVSPVDSLPVLNEVKVQANTRSDTSKGGWAVAFQFVSGGNRFYELTKRNRVTGFNRLMAIIMDGKIVSAPQLNEPLPGSGEITGSFDAKYANQLVSILNAGNLNAELKPDPVSENTIAATLGETTIRNGLIAVAASFIAVLMFMVVYYRFAGFVACVALFVNLLMTVGFMVAMNAAFTLPGLAGIVLMLGMAVDANVLIYERLREEREKGATLAAAIRNGYDRALPTIIDTHLTSIFTSIVLYTFGNDALKGFSIALTVGLIISLFTSLYITRLMFDFWMHMKWLTQLKMLKLFSRPKFDFMKIRHAMFALTAVLTVAGLALFLWRGEKVLNVDFTQGTAYGGRLAAGKEKTLSELIGLLGEERQTAELAVKSVTRNTQAPNANIYDVEYADGSTAQVVLANPPEGATEPAQIENLKKRLSRLPDYSVEQVFLKDDTGDAFKGGKSRSFTVRTTEKEKEVVQVALDRLLRDGNEPLLGKYTVKPFTVTAQGVVRVEFEPPAGSDEGVAPSYFRDFVVRALKTSSFPDEADQVVVTGEPTKVPENGSEDEKKAATAKAAHEAQTQRYTVLNVDFTKLATLKTQLDSPDKAEGAKAFIADQLDNAKRTFEGRPVPERLETFDPSLAKDTRGKALGAILISWLAILGYLWFRFRSWQFGLAAVICLIHDLCFTLGAIALCHYLHDTTIGHWLGLKDFKLDLAAVAALLTLVGYSVNDTIVVFDRIREVRGKNPVLTTQMINDSVNQTLSRTILAALTVFLVAVVLYLFGGEGVHLFAFVMVMGVIVGTYSSIYIASPLLLVFGEGKPKAGLPGGGPTGDQPAERPTADAPASAIAS